MSGRGGGRQGLGTGGTVRHQRRQIDNIRGVTRPAIRRLARRGGVKRISGKIYDETREVLKEGLLEKIIRDAVIYTEHAKRKTVTLMDVIYSLKKNGMTLYSGQVEEHPVKDVVVKSRKRKEKQDERDEDYDMNDDNGDQSEGKMSNDIFPGMMDGLTMMSVNQLEKEVVKEAQQMALIEQNEKEARREKAEEMILAEKPSLKLQIRNAYNKLITTGLKNFNKDDTVLLVPGGNNEQKSIEQWKLRGFKESPNIEKSKTMNASVESLLPNFKVDDNINMDDVEIVIMNHNQLRNLLQIYALKNGSAKDKHNNKRKNNIILEGFVTGLNMRACQCINPKTILSCPLDNYAASAMLGYTIDEINNRTGKNKFTFNFKDQSDFFPNLTIGFLLLTKDVNKFKDINKNQKYPELEKDALALGNLPIGFVIMSKMNEEWFDHYKRNSGPKENDVYPTVSHDKGAALFTSCHMANSFQ